MWPKLIDIHGARLEEMDGHGIEVIVFSVNSPAIQAVAHLPRAIELAQQANDFAARQVSRNPRRSQARWPPCRCRTPTRLRASLRAILFPVTSRSLTTILGFSDR